MKNKKIIGLIVSLLVLLLVIVLFLIGQSHGNKAVESSSQSQSMKKNKSVVTVADTQKNAKLSAAVIGLYGADKLNDDHYWVPVKAGLKNNTTTMHVTSGDDGVINYRFTTDTMNNSQQSGYYQLKGSNRDTVAFYASQADGTIKHYHDISLNDILDYVNDHYGQDKLNTYAQNITISDETSASDTGQSASSSSSSNNVTENEGDDYVIKALVYYGMMNPRTNSAWQEFGKQMKSNSSIIFACSPEGDNYHVTLVQAGSLADPLFHYESAKSQDGQYIHGSRVYYWTEAPDSSNQKTVRTDQTDTPLSMDQVLDFVNKAGGKKMLDSYNIQVNH